jgi:hypothetical protein
MSNPAQHQSAFRFHYGLVKKCLPTIDRVEKPVNKVEKRRQKRQEKKKKEREAARQAAEDKEDWDEMVKCKCGGGPNCFVLRYYTSALDGTFRIDTSGTGPCEFTFEEIESE